MLGRILSGLIARTRAAVPAAEDLLEVARQNFHSRRFAEAEAAYRAFLRGDPTNRTANLGLASSLEAAARNHDAARVCLNFWLLNPSDNQVLEYAIRLIDGLSPADAALEGGAESDYVSLIANANSALAEGKFDSARSILERCREVDARLPFTYQRLGCIEAFAGNFDSASEHFSTWGAAGLAPDAYINLRTAFLEALDPGIDETSIDKPDPAAQAVIFFACDPVYFRRFAHSLLQSLRENAGVPLIVHIHLFNADQWVAEELKELPSGGNLVRVDISSEECEFETSDRAKTYYSCARLYRVADLIGRHGLPVVMLDADVLVLRNLTPLLDLARDHDIALLRWSNTTWRVWDNVYASTVVFGATAGGRRFVHMAERYVREFILRPGGAWFLDQIALFAALAHLQTRGVAVAHIPPHWYALFGQHGNDPIQEAMFWTVTANIPSHLQALSGQLVRRFLPETRRAHGWILPGSDTVLEPLLAKGPTEAGKRRGDHLRMQLVGQHLRMNRRRAIDIGARAGFWSDWLAARFELVNAFEHDLVMRKCFRRNISQANVTLHAYDFGCGDGLPSVAAGSDVAEESRVRQLDDFAYADVDFVNINVVGSCLHILRGAEQTLRRCKPLILVNEVGGTSAGNANPTMPDTSTLLLVELGARLVAGLPDHSCMFSWFD